MWFVFIVRGRGGEEEEEEEEEERNIPYVGRIDQIIQII